MGSFHSKILPSADNVPIADQCVELSTDPRSPTLNINRSPINSEVRTVISCAALTKVKDLTTVLTDHGVLQTPNNLLPKRFQSIIDPRSPSTFDRTPLVVDTDSGITDCSLTNVVSSLQFDETSLVAPEDTGDASFKDCDSDMLPNFCNLQIEYDDKVPILEDRNEVTVFEDAEITPYAGNDPRSPCIAIARTPMVLGKEGGGSAQEAQVKSGDLSEEEMKRVVENQQRTPKHHPIQDSSRSQGDQTPKKDKLSAAKAGGGARTPLGCMTNTGAGTNIRKLALIGHMKQSIATDEQKLITRSPNVGSAETMAGAKHISRSRIPKLRLS
ncbi:uncharacterized protein LOC128268270 [Anopheles cruzii]|uniref:uncharacterized protein LOC128268270 n=1 Tax=Anopheles cruzii TaxID=68878 RepID=UPI0022EC252B|nr:uncharacterized protein LOC128268270 [Anopheles cruzii]